MWNNGSWKRLNFNFNPKQSCANNKRGSSAERGFSCKVSFFMTDKQPNWTLLCFCRDKEHCGRCGHKSSHCWRAPSVLIKAAQWMHSMAGKQPLRRLLMSHESTAAADLDWTQHKHLDVGTKPHRAWTQTDSPALRPHTPPPPPFVRCYSWPLGWRQRLN